MALPHFYYHKLPPNIGQYHILLCDPMVGTGGTATCALDVLTKSGAHQVRETVMMMVVVMMVMVVMMMMMMVAMMMMVGSSFP